MHQGPGKSGYCLHSTGFLSGDGQGPVYVLRELCGENGFFTSGEIDSESFTASACNRLNSP